MITAFGTRVGQKAKDAVIECDKGSRTLNAEIPLHAAT